MARFVWRSRPLLLALCCLFLAVSGDPDVRGQDPIPTGKGKARFKGKGATTSSLKKYDDVITKDAKSSPGVFLVHRLDEKVYFEIPHDSLGKLMLWTIEVAKGPAGVSWGGRSLGDRVIRWERRGNKIYLWTVAFQKRADGKAVQRAVDSASMDTIMLSFNVEAEGKDRSAVIDVTSMFVTDLPDFSVRNAVTGAAGVDDSRSYIEEIKSFPSNIEVRSLLTFRGGGGTGAAGAGTPPPGGRGAGGRRWAELYRGIAL